MSQMLMSTPCVVIESIIGNRFVSWSFFRNMFFQLVIVQAQLWLKFHDVQTPLTRAKRGNLKIGHEDALAQNGCEKWLRLLIRYQGCGR